MNKKFTPTITTFCSVFALLISIGGLRFSYEANQISKKANELSVKTQELNAKQYRNNRSLILQGIFGKQRNEIVVTSVTDSSHFLRGTAYFPTSVHREPVTINSLGKFLGMGIILPNLQRKVLETTKPKIDHYKIIEVDFPLIIKSYYASHGETYNDLSLYLLGITVVIDDPIRSQNSISINDLTFRKRLNLDDDVYQDHLDEMMKDIFHEDGVFYDPKEP